MASSTENNNQHHENVDVNTNANPKIMNTLINAESNTESVSITGVADLQNIQTGLAGIEGKNLCSASLGAKVLFATDDWFATADNLLKDTPPEFDPDAYCYQVSIYISKCCCLLKNRKDPTSAHHFKALYSDNPSFLYILFCVCFFV
jgi:hypothetical protein